MPQWFSVLMIVLGVFSLVRSHSFAERIIEQDMYLSKW